MTEARGLRERMAEQGLEPGTLSLPDFYIVTSEEIHGVKIRQTLGLVMASLVVPMPVMENVVADTVIDELVRQCKAAGGNAIVAFRLVVTTNYIFGTGTAVNWRPGS